jgi:hypothetical protein
LTLAKAVGAHAVQTVHQVKQARILPPPHSWHVFLKKIVNKDFKMDYLVEDSLIIDCAPAPIFDKGVDRIRQDFQMFSLLGLVAFHQFNMGS